MAFAPQAFASGSSLTGSGAQRPGGGSGGSGGGAHGSGGGAGNAGGGGSSAVPSGGYTTKQAPAGAQNRLNIEAFKARLAKMRTDKANGNYTTGNCGRGVRELLDILMPKKVGSSANAGSWSTSILNKWAPPCYASVQDSNPTYQNFDVKDMPHNSGQGSSGHVEIYYEGQWYSDFSQPNSLAANTKRYDSSKVKVYRMTDSTSCVGGSMLSPLDSSTEHAQYLYRSLSEWMLPSAQANTLPKKDKGNEKAENPPSKVEKILASVNSGENVSWKVIEMSDPRRVGVYQLYKYTGEVRKLISENDITIFHLLDPYKSNKLVPAAELARQDFDNWVKEVGKERAQKLIRAVPEMATLQKDTYVEAGFKLPDQYIISVSDSK